MNMLAELVAVDAIKQDILARARTQDRQGDTPLAGPADGFTRISNIWTVIRGPLAFSESYTMSGGKDVLRGGRYLDRHECGADGWRLKQRRHVEDWFTGLDIPTPDLAIAGAALFAPRGGTGGQDPAALLHALGHARAALSPEQGKTMSETISPKDVETLIARDALHRLVVTYCRAIDRGDSEMLASIFHCDAVIIAGVYNGPAQNFAREVPAIVQAGLEMCFHSVANEWFEIDGDHAVGECYVVAFNRSRDATAPQESMVAGRYVDRFERRDGLWKISERVFVEDWRSVRPASPPPPRQDGCEYGAFGRIDPVYRFWPVDQ
ncbi:nuclear transport factor 2 family protein [Sphingobium sp. TB-6]|uniref:nuclear transport factor 2 family protein n=1 Tax=Sphingobium sp. TB-6 TaxID=2728850 RepID=UPI00146CB5A4|nr:nuclear transport factor 2 family protein [Sphingobium sp. TB-6]NML90654.1 nuclear transport factor 2 family protein [Sphingobium sp. TB-6]